MKQNLKMYLMLIPAVIIIIAVIVSQVINIKNAFSDDVQKPADSDELSIRFELNPEVLKIEDREENLNTKVENYREGERKLRETGSTEISFSSVFKNNNTEQTKETAVVNEPRETRQEPQSQNRSTPAQRTSIPSQSSTRTSVPAQTHQSIDESSTSTAQPVYSMAVYQAQTSQTGNANKNEVSNSLIQDYINAVLEEDKTIENGSNVIFILSKTVIIAGITHNPGSTLYGRAKLIGDMFDILVYQIKSTDGKMYICSLTVYDENYNQGIRTGGEVNRAARENTNDAALQQLDVSTTSGAVNTAVKTIARTASQTTNRKVTVSLRKGYKVYLKEINR